MTLPLKSYYRQVPGALAWTHADLALRSAKLWFMGRGMLRANRRLTSLAEAVLGNIEDLNAVQAVAFWASFRSVVEWVQSSGIKELEPLLPRMKKVLDSAAEALQQGYHMDTNGPLEAMLIQARESDEAWQNDPREDIGMYSAIEEALHAPDMDSALLQRIRAAE